jgi:oligoendopeptidase F
LKKLVWLLSVVTFSVLAAESDYHYDLSRLFATDQAERLAREEVLKQLDAFERDESAVESSAALLRRLHAYEDLLRGLRKHEAYVYLQSERDSEDRDAAAAEDLLSSALGRARLAVQKTLSVIDEVAWSKLINADHGLSAYTYFVQSAHRANEHSRRGVEASSVVIQPTLSVLADSYRRLSRRPPLTDDRAPDGAEAQFNASWRPFQDNEDAFAALLTSVVTLQNGQARLQGFADAPEKKFFDLGLESQQVDAVLEAVRSAALSHLFVDKLRHQVGRRLNIPPDQVRAWQLQEVADKPAPIAFPDAIQLILAGEKPMGREYSDQYDRLLARGGGRVEWCRSAHCDATGFSFGFSGVESGLFYGAYDGTTNTVCATAHESGHAVHRQLMAEHQVLPVYQSGPSFLNESIAIFNELLALDHLYRSASMPAARQYYLRQFLEDGLSRIYGSAGEVALERAIYAGVADRSVRSAADLDRLASEVLPRFEAPPGFDPAMKVYWARNRLYFTDPLYDTNYLFAGLLALNYFGQYEADAKGFSRRYVALLKNGHTDAPETLLRKMLGIDLRDAKGLMAGAETVLSQRMKMLD